jgi:hypothetical protein
MTDDRPNDEREALIAGDRRLEPDQAAELALLADLLADPSTWADPSPGLEDAIVRAVTDAKPAAATSAPRADAGSRHEAEQSRRRRVVVSLVAAAAAIAIVVVVAAVALSRGAGSPDYAANLSATALAPGAHATVDIDKTAAGFRVTLDASGLPHLQAGEYYQAWLKNAAGVLVPIGTFSSSDGRVTLWSGVSPKAYPTITVTIEAADADQSSSGRRVLVGDARAG